MWSLALGLVYVRSQDTVVRRAFRWPFNLYESLAVSASSDLLEDDQTGISSKEVEMFVTMEESGRYGTYRCISQGENDSSWMIQWSPLKHDA